ncbi:PKD domain-containing protein [Methanospirillum stamsii]|nr:PKD domain-containing protein [Methanospirillum stamsii]
MNARKISGIIIILLFFSFMLALASASQIPSSIPLQKSISSSIPKPSLPVSYSPIISSPSIAKPVLSSTPLVVRTPVTSSFHEEKTQMEDTIVTQSSEILTLDGIQIFPEDNIWNVPIDTMPVDPRSDDYIRSMGGDTQTAKPQFYSGLKNGVPWGIPYNVVPGDQPKVDVTIYYEHESDCGPYPIPENPLIQQDHDFHMLIVDKENGYLYELNKAIQQADGNWTAGSGAVYNLSSNDLRTICFTSADAAGLPILPGLVRYEEVAAGEIRHAIRTTAIDTQKAFVWPARHYASDLTNPEYPPMGQRFRLKSSFDTSGYPDQARVIMEAMKKYGVILADNAGGSWDLSGVPDERWDNEALKTLRNIKGTDFEAVNVTSLMIHPDSAQARTSVTPSPLTLTSVMPNSAQNYGAIPAVNLTGSDFTQGINIYLNLTGQPDIYATNIDVQSSEFITCNFPITGKIPGQWDIIVTNPDGRTIKQDNGFTITTSEQEPIQSKFYGIPGTEIFPLTIQFIDASTGSPSAWQWNFGDGNNSTEQNPIHTYNTPGVFIVQLIVANNTIEISASSIMTITNTNHLSVQNNGFSKISNPENILNKEGQVNGPSLDSGSIPVTREPVYSNPVIQSKALNVLR